MDIKVQLNAFIDGVVNNDAEVAANAFSQYVKAKTRNVLGYTDETAEVSSVQESCVLTLNEYANARAQNPVQFRGDKVTVEGKVVGAIQYDPLDFEGGINFIEEGGNFSKEFETVEQLYDFLIQRYTKEGSKQ